MRCATIDDDPSWWAVLSDAPIADKIAASTQEYADHAADWFRGGWALHPGHARYYCRRLRGNFGGRFLGMLASVYFGVKGVMTSLLGLVALPLFIRHYRVGIERYQSYAIAVMVPWSVKPLIGLVSDRVPLWGLHKTPYIAGATLVGAVSVAALAAKLTNEQQAPPGPGNSSSGNFSATQARGAAALLGGASTQAAVTDLLTEGKYAELMSYRPAASSDLTTYVSLLYFVSAVVAAAIVGPLVERGRLALVAWLAVVPSAQIIGPLLARCFPERRHGPAPPSVPTAYVGLAGATAACAVGMAAVNVLYSQPGPKVAYSVVSSAMLCTVAAYTLPQVLARSNLYLFLSSASYLSLSGALDAYYTATAPCVADGPHFSMTYYLTVSTVVGAIVGVLATCVCQSVMRGWLFRRLFWVGTSLKCAAALVDLAIVFRWNRRVGVSDYWTYMLGHNIATTIVAQMDWMPAVVLTAKLCPPGHEATVYALLAGFQNYGGAVASSIGTALTSMADVHLDTDGATCNFARLPQLILLGHVMLPALMLPLTFVLIPNARMTDSLRPE